MSTLHPPGHADGSSPFDNNHADPWAKTFVDLPSLNAKVTDAITAAIQNVRTAARKDGAELRTSSILVLGPAGAGKTHLFARLRHKLGPRAVFVHLRPLVGTEMTPRYVLGQIVQQLGYETAEGHGLKQLEALVGSSFAQLDGSNPEFPRIFVGEIASLDEAKRTEKIEWAVEKLLERHQEADEMYLARLLAAPFMKPAQQRAALAWLAGRELEESQMKRLGVTSSLPDERIIQALQTLGVFAAPGAPIVLVFDQLENLMDAEATGTRVRAYANLVAELFDTMRGYVLVQMALDTEWQQGILPQLSAAQKTRLGGEQQVIALPTPPQSRELIARWVDHLHHRAEPFPWPFGERRVAMWAETPGMTPRMLMIACKQALALGPDAPFEDAEPLGVAPETVRSSSPTPLDDGADDAALEIAWESHLQHARAALDEAAEDRRSADPARLVGGMACALRFADGVTTSRVDARLHLQLVARVGDRTHAVALLHQTHPRSAGTALERAADALTKDGVVLVRERAIEVPPTWKKFHSTLATVLKKGARWITLERDDAARLLALESFIAASKSRDLEDAGGRAFEEREVAEWIARSLRVVEWPLIAALVGRGDVPTDEPVSTPEPSAPAEASGTGAAATSASGPGAKSASAPGAKSGSGRDAKSASGPGAKSASGPGASFAGDTAATIRACLGLLQIASLERLVREVVRARPDTTRNEIVSLLEAMPDHVRWFGRAIVAVKDAIRDAGAREGR